MAATTQITDKIVSNAIVGAVRNVCWTMLQQMPSLVAADSDAESVFEVIGSVGFAGEVNGLVYLCLSNEFARQATSHILGMSLGEIDHSDSDLVKDAIGEITNMTAGGFKNELCDLGFPCKLGLPAILRGERLAIAPAKSAARQVFRFSCCGHFLVADILIRND